MVGAPVRRIELFEDYDVALLDCTSDGSTALNVWLTNRAQPLMDLSSFGYPHAVTRLNDTDHFDVVFRAYKGHVITTRGFERLPARPAVYEVSCPYPQGMSGAPVLLTIGNQLAVAGMVLGSDTVEYAGVPHTVGIAISADEICLLHSQLLGGRIASALRFEGATWTPG